MTAAVAAAEEEVVAAGAVCVRLPLLIVGSSHQFFGHWSLLGELALWLSPTGV